MADMRWVAMYDADTDIAQVCPEVDDVPHDLDDPAECVCGPKVTMLEDGGWLYSHQPLIANYPGQSTD